MKYCFVLNFTPARRVKQEVEKDTGLDFVAVYLLSTKWNL